MFNSENTLEEQEKFGIYEIRNKITNDVYVGATTQSFEKRWRNHYTYIVNKKYTHHCKMLQDNVEKYGIENFNAKIVSIEEDKSNVWMREREIYDEYKDNGEKLLNYRPSGYRNATMSEQTRQKLLKTWERKKKDGSSKACGWNKGKHLPEEVRRKISQNSHPWHKGKKTGIVPKTAFKKGGVPWNKGIKMSEEAKQKRSNNQMWHQRLSDAAKRRNK